MVVKLTVGEIEILRTLLARHRARSGFRNLLLHVWYRLDEATGELELPVILLERINRYAFAYRSREWRRALRSMFRRTLGANLDRGLSLK